MTRAQVRFERIELKYVVPAPVAARLAAELAPSLRPDAHGGGTGRYVLWTLYFDTPERDVHWERETGARVRRKLRVRAYGAAARRGPCFVEIKHRADGRVAKRRIALPLEAALALCAGRDPGALPEADRAVAGEVRDLVATRDLRPSCLMRYERLAHAAPGGDDGLRVTFDTDMRYRFENPTDFDADAFEGRVLPATRCIMEVKVDRAVPYWLTLLVARHGCVLGRVSKYSLALEDAASRAARLVPRASGAAR